MKRRILMKPAIYAGVDVAQRTHFERVLYDAFCNAGLSVSMERISLSREQAEQVIPFERSNPMYESEVLSLSEPGKFACLITLEGDNVEDLLRRYLSLGLDESEVGNFISESPELVKEFGNGKDMQQIFLDVTKMQL